jgi:murein DD-endopeptidase MepM/ murein hydrolase activator NlpD
MSEIDVKVGQQVKLGQSLGKVGTTGRSTGPHLHYETRIDGEAVDPQKFIAAGGKLAGTL